MFVFCLCVHVHMYGQVHEHVFIHACEGPQIATGVFLDHSPYMLNQGFSPNLELAVLAGLTSHLAPGMPHL